MSRRDLQCSLSLTLPIPIFFVVCKQFSLSTCYAEHFPIHRCVFGHARQVGQALAAGVAVRPSVNYFQPTGTAGTLLPSPLWLQCHGPRCFVPPIPPSTPEHETVRTPVGDLPNSFSLPPL